jgi:hypothetical protein
MLCLDCTFGVLKVSTQPETLPTGRNAEKTVNITAQCNAHKKHGAEDTSRRTPLQSKHNITKYGIIYLAF